MIKFAERSMHSMEKRIKVVPIKNKDIITNKIFRDYCEQNTCGHYGANWMCPPGVGNIESLMDKIRDYRDGILIQTVYNLNDSFDFEGMTTAAEQHNTSFISLLKEIELHIDRQLLLPLNAGHCRLCEECNYKKNIPCRYPDKAIASVESHGVDVAETLKNIGLNYINGQNTVSYVGVILEK